MVFSEDFLTKIAVLNLEEKFEFQDLIRSFLKDFHRMIKMNQHLKKIIKTSLSMNDSLDLNQSIRNFTAETCLIFDCFQAKIFIVDEINKEFWTKNAKEGLERISFDQGDVLSHTMKLKKVLKIDDWKKSQFVNINSRQFSIKTMVCSPIVDNKGKIIGFYSSNLLKFSFDSW